MTVLPLPSTYEYGFVVGRVIRAIADSPEDVDRLPEARGVGGTVTFTPTEKLRKVTGHEGQAAIVAHSTVKANLDGDGYLVSDDGEHGIWLIEGQWSVQFSLEGTTASIEPFLINVDSTTHTLVAPLDLASVAPYTPPSGVTVVTYTLPDGGTTGQVLVKASNTHGDAEWGDVEGAGGVSDHGALTGLSDDDHPQYHNNARGDARYSLLAHNHAGVYATPSDVTTASTADRTRANHTGTQSSATISDLTEAVQDIVGTMLVSGAEITLAYNDTTGQLTVTGSGGNAELMRDTIGAAFVGVNGITITPNDGADTITVGISGLTISQVTGLQAALDAKSATGHTHLITEVVNLETTLEDLTSGLGDKSDVGHTHVAGDISGAMTLEQMAPGGVFVVNYVAPDWKYNNATITARPSARANIRMWAVGGTTPPSFALTHDMHSPEVA